MARVQRRLFELTDLREHEWNPLRHNPGPLLNALTARPFAPAAYRLGSLAVRLATVPDALAVARAVLRDCPRIQLETALGQFAGAASLIRTELPALLAEAPSMQGLVTPAADAAIEALDEFGGWLRNRLAQPGDGRSPRLGRRLWAARLRHVLDSDLTASDLLARAEVGLERVAGELREAAAMFVGGPATDETVREALSRLGTDRPDNSSILDFAQRSLEDCTEFVRKHDLVSLVDAPCVMQEMPEFARGMSVAYCDPPGRARSAFQDRSWAGPSTPRR